MTSRRAGDEYNVDLMFANGSGKLIGLDLRNLHFIRRDAVMLEDGIE